MLLCVSLKDDGAQPNRPKQERRYGWEFFCKVCANEFEADWQLGGQVTCPRCHTVFETGWQFTEKGQLVGPWLTRRAEAKSD
jgi:hypothetical protein